VSNNTDKLFILELRNAQNHIVSEVFHYIRHKIKEKHLKIILDCLEREKVIIILDNHVEFFWKNKVFMKLLHESKYWEDFEQSVIKFTDKISNSGYNYLGNKKIDEMFGRFEHELFSKESKEKLPKIIRIKFCKDLKELSKIDPSDNVFGAPMLLAEGSSLELFKSKLPNNPNTHKYFLYSILRSSFKNSEHGLEIAKHIINILYENNDLFSLKIMDSSIAKNIKDHEFLKFILKTRFEFEKFNEFNHLVKNGNYSMCRMYMKNYDFIVNHVNKFYKDNKELELILDRINFERMQVA
jgi:hypothetical protein